MKKNTMFLLEVYDAGGKLSYRRISESIGAIEDWLESNAHKWAYVPVAVDCDMYGNGVIHANGAVWYTFTTTNIAVV